MPIVFEVFDFKEEIFARKAGSVNETPRGKPRGIGLASPVIR